MINKTRTIFFFFCVIVLSFTFFNFEENHLEQNISTRCLFYKEFNLYNLEPNSDSPIIIDSDSDFISYSFPGNGSEQAPYLIQNLDIETASDVGIVIVNTTKNFIVQDCSITAKFIGLYLNNNSGFFQEIYNNTLNNIQYYGIYAFLCPNVKISDNRCFSNNIGLAIFFSDNCYITENFCYENENGIVAQYTIDTTIINNTCKNNTFGINCAYAISLDIYNNTCTNNREGVSGYDVDFSTFSNNTITYTDGGFNLYACDNTEIIENCLEYNYYGIIHTSGHSTNITKNKCLENTYGIRVSSSDSTIVEENVCNKNSLDGIYIRKGTSALIVNNTCNDNLENGIYDSYWGMYIAEPHEIRGNICNNNKYGIQLEETDRIDVLNNTCSGNLQGIVLKDSSSTEIVFNVLQDNIEYGVSLLDIYSSNNKIHHNDFINNNKKGTEFGKSQGYDYGFSNEWYDKHSDEGNYWSNLRNKDEYSLDGPRNSADPYPLNSPVNNDITHKTSFNVAISVISLIVFTLYTSSLFRKKRIN